MTPNTNTKIRHAGDTDQVACKPSTLTIWQLFGAAFAHHHHHHLRLLCTALEAMVRGENAYEAVKEEDKRLHDAETAERRQRILEFRAGPDFKNQEQMRAHAQTNLKPGDFVIGQYRSPAPPPDFFHAWRKHHDKEVEMNREAYLSAKEAREAEEKRKQLESEQKQLELRKSASSPGQLALPAPAAASQLALPAPADGDADQRAVQTTSAHSSAEAEMEAQAREQAEQVATAFREDPRCREIAFLQDRLANQVVVWEVTGGGAQGGILVREGVSLQSLLVCSPERSRLLQGSLVREFDRKGERIFYKLLEGRGPQHGWISLKIKNVEVLTNAAEEPCVAERAKSLLRRLAMVPSPFQNLLRVPVAPCVRLTQSIHGRRGCLARLAKSKKADAWLQHAAMSAGLAVFPGFSPGDPVLASLLADSSLTPLRRVFPRPRRADDDIEYIDFVEVIDPVNGLLPDSMRVAYFLRTPGADDCDSLVGAVRFGAHSTQSMAHTDPQDEGQFTPFVHGGAMASVLYDAALWLARLSRYPNAVLKKISCQFSKSCPAFQTLRVEAKVSACVEAADFSVEGVCREPTQVVGEEPDGVVIKVSLKSENVLIATAEVVMVSFPLPDIRLPADLPQGSLAPPSVDWVPRALACARLPAHKEGRVRVPPWDKDGYMKAARDIQRTQALPVTCAAVEETTKEADLKARGIHRIERANMLDGVYRNDLCFTAGLAPAAISHVHYFDKTNAGGIRFEGQPGRRRRVHVNGCSLWLAPGCHGRLPGTPAALQWYGEVERDMETGHASAIIDSNRHRIAISMCLPERTNWRCWNKSGRNH
eukprot:TRINITY_DN8802_c0_g1_i2.p1 TRINITY_DN8802_c0_g1~~TRINITY_DN8802_c0_g1_i2.p1  ORF type:complete len:821 (-),score=126.20 TRINITY_DN8802_c0_g1_i2:178-2640(-)